MVQVISSNEDGKTVCLECNPNSWQLMDQRTTPETIKVACSNCNLRELCMPIGFNPEDMQKLDEVVATRPESSRVSDYSVMATHSHRCMQFALGFLKLVSLAKMAVNKSLVSKWLVKSSDWMAL